MNQNISNPNAVSSIDWEQIVSKFFEFAKEKPYIACYLFTAGCVAYTIYAIKTHPFTKAEAIIASN